MIFFGVVFVTDFANPTVVVLVFFFHGNDEDELKQLVTLLHIRPVIYYGSLPSFAT